MSQPHGLKMHDGQDFAAQACANDASFISLSKSNDMRVIIHALKWY